tara:strand:+ start:1029 stop:3086 length:2058 start_codon:yes stop_codon:yes gene_type:complete
MADSLQTVSPPKNRNPGQIDFTREHDSLLDRFMASSKMTPEGVASYYEARGFKVATAKDGRVFLNDPDSGTWYPVDKSGVDASSIATDAMDLGGDVAQAIPSLVSPAKIVGQAGAGGVGNLIRQAASALTPGDDKMSLADRAISTAVDTSIGGGIQGAFSGLSKLGPRAYVAQRLGRLSNTPYARESARLEAASGLVLTPGQRTGSKALQMFEGVLRRAPGSADPMFANEVGQLKRGLEYFDLTLDTLYGPKKGKSGIGNLAVQGYTRAVDAAQKIRSKTRDVDLTNLTRASRDQPMFQLDNTLYAIDNLIAENTVPAGAGGDATSAMLVRLKNLRASLSRETPSRLGGVTSNRPPATAQELQRYLQIYGKAAKGKSVLFENVDKTSQQGIAARVFGALQDDLNSAADAAAGSNAPSAKLLQAFRNNWRENSNAISEITDSALGRFINKDGADDRVSDAIMRLSGDELKETMVILNRVNPDIANQVKRLHFSDAFEKAGIPLSPESAEVFTSAARSADDAGIDWSPKKLLSALQKSPVWTALPPPERANIRDSVQVMVRLAKREGDGSPTAPLQWAREIASGLAKFSAAPFFALMGARKMAEIVTTKDGQKMLGDLFKTPKNPRYKRAVTNFIAFSNVGDDTADENVRPTPEISAGDPSGSPRQPRNFGAAPENPPAERQFRNFK